ncbi:MAG: homoserine kinase [Clostridiaceae bacterium]
MIKISVPGTSANLGPGFDCLGIALNLYNSFYVEEIQQGFVLENCDDEYNNEDNLVYSTAMNVLNRYNKKIKGLKIKFCCDIPTSRGLGSSASCIVAGVYIANELGNLNLCQDEIFNISSKIEGHPDNVAPAIYGGMTASLIENDKVYTQNINIKDGLKFLAIIPNYQLSTKKSREVLPEKIDYKDGVYNIGRVSYLISCLINGDFEKIRLGLQDKLHEPYRGKLIRNFNDIRNKALNLDAYGVYLSGAGPTMMAIVDNSDDKFENNIVSYLKTFDVDYDVLELSIDKNGVIVENI